MKRPYSFLALLLALVSTVLAQDPRVEKPRTHVLDNPGVYTGEVSVAFWNIEWFPAGPAARDKVSATAIRNHVKAVAEILNDENPTILIACEIRNLPAAILLNEHLKEPYPYIAVTDYQADNSSPKESSANNQEHALFSRIPWTEIWEVDFVGSLPLTDDRPSRGYIGARFKIDGDDVTVFGVHPKSNYIRRGEKEPELTALKNVEKRERASRYLLENIRRRELDPLEDKIIVMGDFNTDVYAERFQGEKSLKMILQAGFYNGLDDVDSLLRVTIPAKKGERWPDSVFDYILTSVGLGQVPVTVIQRGATKDTAKGAGTPGHASDHYMMKAVLPLPDSHPPLVVEEPTPSMAQEETPEPAAVLETKAEPIPPPVVGKPVSPEPETVDWVELTKNKTDWPKEVMLRESVTFPAVSGGKQFGTVELSPGTKVKLLEVLSNQVKVAFEESTAVIPVEATDLEARVLAKRRTRTATDRR
jgi:endonuclease/exonuclease/phosphatase family metal-dependent hydrolase